ncbi:hypothetical protein HQ584_06355, partial [Patescibacteria group bacterium]|nr:hypothetical protein [Patescibacteria group bacterium]
QEVDYFYYYANPFMLCSNCGKRTSRGGVDLPYCGDAIHYYKKFIDGHFKVVTFLTQRGVDFSQDIDEKQEHFFDYDWDLAGGVLDIYTSFEMFLYQLTFNRIEKYRNDGGKIEMDAPNFFKDYPEIQKIIILINSNKKTEIKLIMDGISNNFSVRDCMKLLKVISPEDKKTFGKCFALQEMRNNIVHRGMMANFEDYATAFIEVGKIFNTYNGI